MKTKFKHPKTNQQEILLTLITNGKVSLFDFPYLVSFRTRVSDLQLKHGIFLERVRENKTNKFGNVYSYVIYGLPESSYEKAVELYHELSAKPLLS